MINFYSKYVGNGLYEIYVDGVKLDRLYRFAEIGELYEKVREEKG